MERRHILGIVCLLLLLGAGGALFKLRHLTPSQAAKQAHMSGTSFAPVSASTPAKAGKKPPVMTDATTKVAAITHVPAPVARPKLKLPLGPDPNMPAAKRAQLAKGLALGVAQGMLKEAEKSCSSGDCNRCQSLLAVIARVPTTPEMKSQVPKNCATKS